MSDSWVPVQSPRGKLRLKAGRVGERNTIVGIEYENEDGITSDDLRRLPVAAMEMLLNHPAVMSELSALSDKLDAISGPIPNRALAQLDRLIDDAMRERSTPPKRSELRLPRHKGTGKKPDSFYMALATAYSRLVHHRMRPAAELAAANNVPLTTVHRWVREARARGFLPAQGRKGRAG